MDYLDLLSLVIYVTVIVTALGVVTENEQTTCYVKEMTARYTSNADIANKTDHLQHQIETGGPGLFFLGLSTIIFGAFGNGFVIYVFLRSEVLRAPTLMTPMKTVLHLAITDLITMVMSGYSILSLILNVKIQYACLLNSMLTMYMISVTQCVLLVTNLDRYISICHHERYCKILTKRSFNIFIALAWLLPLPFHTSPLMGYANLNDAGKCIPRNLYPHWFLITQSILFFLIMTFTVSLFIPVLSKAIQFHIKTAPANFYGVNASTARLKAKRRAIRYSIFIGVLTFVFLICNFPSSILRLRFGLGYSGSNTSFIITFYFGLLNCVINPFIYACQNQIFRKEAVKFIPCKCFKRDSSASQLSRETQLRREHVLPYPEQHKTPRNAVIQDISQDAEVEIVMSGVNHKFRHNTSGYLAPLEAPGNPDQIEVGTVHTSAPFSIAMPRLIHVWPYEEKNLLETSL